jgi:pseudouridine-5'-phosphate glycosidase
MDRENIMHITTSQEVADALAEGRPVVALESTVISHGLPYPDNLNLAAEMEAIVRAEGAVPATVAVIDGQLRAGLSEADVMRLADGSQDVRKISRRDLASAVAGRHLGATTVAATMMIAYHAGISVFATGGIGGVHRGDANDISADLVELSQTRVAVVCAGAKAILDLPRTLEWLETFGVPVVGFGTDEFPAFYTPSSGLDLVDCVDTAQDAAKLLAAHESLDLPSGILFTVPIPQADALDSDEIGGHIEFALAEAEAQEITGKEITPFLLGRLVGLTGGKSLAANLALLRNNGRVAAQIAVAHASLRHDGESR